MNVSKFNNEFTHQQIMFHKNYLNHNITYLLQVELKIPSIIGKRQPVYWLEQQQHLATLFIRGKLHGYNQSAELYEISCYKLMVRE